MIYLLAPDEPRPTGGVLIMYRMVDRLNALGRPSRVWHGTRGFRCDWFENDTAIVAAPRLVLEPGDVLVIPEHAGHRYRDRVGDAPVVMLIQAQWFTFAGAGVKRTLPGAFPGWTNVAAVIATSDAVERFVAAAVAEAVPLHRVRCLVDADRFRSGVKRRVIAFMSRRNFEHAEVIVQLLRRNPASEGWEMRPIDGIGHAEVAEQLAEAAIFLTVSSWEGFGLPAAEAMAAGCAVVGFTGDGGREFMDPRWSYPVPFPDFAAFADAAAEAMRMFEEDRPQFDARSAAGRDHIASTYARLHFDHDVAAAFDALAVQAGQPAPVRLRHWDSRSPRQRVERFVRRWVPPPAAHWMHRRRETA